MARSDRRPKKSPSLNPRDRQPVARNVPDNFNRERPAWHVGLMDLDQSCPWSFNQLNNAQWWQDVHSKLRNFETMTWQAIIEQAGGRSRGTNNHDIPIEDLIPEARRCLRALGEDHLFSLRLTGTVRIWGIREGIILKFLWYDPEHAICPTST